MTEKKINGRTNYETQKNTEEEKKINFTARRIGAGAIAASIAAGGIYIASEIASFTNKSEANHTQTQEPSPEDKVRLAMEEGPDSTPVYRSTIEQDVPTSVSFEKVAAEMAKDFGVTLHEDQARSTLMSSRAINDEIQDKLGRAARDGDPFELMLDDESGLIVKAPSETIDK